ncbi:MAG: ATP-binding protein, partial [Firmicutes bacterium]|nr:ATP-binding protein [Bacillota bacterium]
MFLGRINELNELNSMYAESGFRFVAIYGRRRVGKTALISEFCKGKDCIFHVAIEQN